MTTATATRPATQIFLYRSTTPRMETQADWQRDNLRRRANGEPGRDTLREPCRRHDGPWHSFRPFEDEPDAEPYAVVETIFRVTADQGGYGEPIARVGTGTGVIAMSPADVLEAATAGQFGLRVAGGPLVGEIEGLAVEREAERLARIAAADAERERRVRATEEVRAAEAAAPTPAVGAMVWLWSRQVLGVGHTTSTERLTPWPAVVIVALPRDPGGPPPELALVVFDEAGATPRGSVPFSLEPRDGCWTWPIADFSPKPFRPVYG